MLNISQFFLTTRMKQIQKLLIKFKLTLEKIDQFYSRHTVISMFIWMQI